MALFHLSVTQTKRSAGQSAIASAAYRAGERLYSEYYGEYSDYTRKGGVICSDIFLPSMHRPNTQTARPYGTPWKSRAWKERPAHTALTLPCRMNFPLRKTSLLQGNFVGNFVSRGMVVDFAVHQPDREDGGIPNPFSCALPHPPHRAERQMGTKSNAGCMSWTRTATVSGTRTESLFSTPFPLPTGAVPKRWNTGGKHGRSYAMPSLRKKVLMFVSTTGAMSVRAWSFFHRPRRRNRPGNGEEGHTHRERRVQPLDQGNQCRYPGHQEENHSPV